MIYGIFGEPCVGKSTLALALKKEIGGKIITDEEYLHYAEKEGDAERIFMERLNTATGNIFYIITKPYQLYFLPQNACKIKLLASIQTIEKRFAQKMYGHLPDEVKERLEESHGMFDFTPADFVFTEEDELEEKLHTILI